MEKMYYLIASYFVNIKFGSYNETQIVMSSKNIQEVQSYLHEKYLECMADERIYVLNGLEKYLDNSCENTDAMIGQRTPKEFKNHLTYKIYSDCLTIEEHHVMYKIISCEEDENICHKIESISWLPDSDISVKEMYNYGYLWKCMLPLQIDKARELFENHEIYLLYGDDTEDAAFHVEELVEHAERDGIFGITEEAWVSHLDKLGF